MKGERLKEFKKRSDAFVGETKRVSVLAQGASHVNEARYHIRHSLAQHQVLFVHAEVFKTAFLAGVEDMLAGFPNKEKSVEEISRLAISADTCARRCEDLSGDVFKQLLKYLRACSA